MDYGQTNGQVKDQPEGFIFSSNPSEIGDRYFEINSSLFLASSLIAITNKQSLHTQRNFVSSSFDNVFDIRITTKAIP